MADGDFPDSYETKTTTTTTSSTTVCTYNVAYIQTLDGMLRIAEIVVGLIYWIFVAATHYYYNGRGFVMSASIIIWIFTIIIFCLYLFMVVERITIINWPLSEFISNVIWAICHFIGIIILLVAVTQLNRLFAFWVSFICSFGITFLYAFHAFLGFKRGVVSFRSETSGATVQT